MAALDDLFANPELQPGWRAPTKGDHVCHVCKGAACYGEGRTWCCRTCVPAGFLPADRSAR